MSNTNGKQETLISEIGNAAAADLESLRTEWRLRWGEPPRYRSRDLLMRAFLYKLQSEASGDLPAQAQRRLADLGRRFMADRSFVPPAANKLLPGSSLIREWQGKRHEVAVVDGGFVYQSETFRSLSSVAHRITGTKWNGPVFFGLKRRAAS
jgi:hypothetical protein